MTSTSPPLFKGCSDGRVGVAEATPAPSYVNEICEPVMNWARVPVKASRTSIIVGEKATGDGISYESRKA